MDDSSTITIAPPQSQLDTDVADALEALTFAASLAGPGASIFARYTITCPTPEQVDRIAAGLGTEARWNAPNGTVYLTGNRQIEAAHFGRRAAATGNGPVAS